MADHIVSGKLEYTDVDTFSYGSIDANSAKFCYKLEPRLKC